MFSSVNEFLKHLSKHVSLNSNRFLYRGQANAEWRVDCSAVRRLNKNPTADIDQSLTGYALVGYLNDLLEKASILIGTCNELPHGCSQIELLVQLQHHGAATGLIDFTLDPLIALWFACNGFPDENGAVYVLAREDTKEIELTDLHNQGVLNYFHGPEIDWESTLHIWLPSKIKGRPASQQSVFVLGVPVVPPYLLKRALIDKDAKEQMLVELRREHGITEESLFADLPGFSMANTANKTIDVSHTLEFWLKRLEWFTDGKQKAQAHVDLGLAYTYIGEYDAAIEHFNIGINIDPECIRAYVCRAEAYRSLGILSEALNDYNAAIDIYEKDGLGMESKMVVNLIYSRGSTYVAMGDERGYDEMNRAIQAGLKVGIHLYYHTEKDRVEHHPEHMEHYKDI